MSASLASKIQSSNAELPADKLLNLITDPFIEFQGTVLGISGQTIRIADRLGVLEIGARVCIHHEPKGARKKKGDDGAPILAEIVSLDCDPDSGGEALALAFGSVDGIRRGCRVDFSNHDSRLFPSTGWLGRVIDGLGRAVDGYGEMPHGATALNLKQGAPKAALRARLGDRIEMGVKALDAFTPVRAGQRLGIFSGSGVGKSSLLGMIARNVECDVRIIALIGERGREVREFIEDDLGEEGLSKSIVIVSTADEPALMRREAGFLAMALAEHFRDQGLQVMCMIDRLTRIAMAQREIGLAAGEPPALRGYTPSVFSLLPALLERAGPGLLIDPDHPERCSGAITGLFTVLVEGDDHDEPISDHCRAILDGHVVLDREISERGRFPAVNILKSLSRTASEAMSARECNNYVSARQMAALYENMSDMINIGAYKIGTNPEVDQAINFYSHLEEFLTQLRDHKVSHEETSAQLSQIVVQAKTK